MSTEHLAITRYDDSCLCTSVLRAETVVTPDTESLRVAVPQTLHSKPSALTSRPLARDNAWLGVRLGTWLKVGAGLVTIHETV